MLPRFVSHPARLRYRFHQLPTTCRNIIVINILDPFCWLSHKAQKRLWFGSLVISAISLSAIKVLDESLVNDVAPSGIISFEFARSITRSQQILSSWVAAEKIRCALSIGIDYLFLATYALFISVGCVYIANALKIRRLFLAKIGFLLAWTQFIAALLDAIENTALIQLLLGSRNEMYSWIAWGCAGFKFAFVGLGLIYMVSGFILIRIFIRGSN